MGVERASEEVRHLSHLVTHPDHFALVGDSPFFRIPGVLFEGLGQFGNWGMHHLTDKSHQGVRSHLQNLTAILGELNVIELSELENVIFHSRTVVGRSETTGNMIGPGIHGNMFLATRDVHVDPGSIRWRYNLIPTARINGRKSETQGATLVGHVMIGHHEYEIYFKRSDAGSIRTVHEVQAAA